MLYSFNNIQWLFIEHLIGVTHCGRPQREKVSKTEQISYHVHNVLILFPSAKESTRKWDLL